MLIGFTLVVMYLFLTLNMIIYSIKQKEINIYFKQNLKKKIRLKIVMDMTGQKQALDIVKQKDLKIINLLTMK